MGLGWAGAGLRGRLAVKVHGALEGLPPDSRYAAPWEAHGFDLGFAFLREINTSAGRNELDEYCNMALSAERLIVKRKAISRMTT